MQSTRFVSSFQALMVSAVSRVGTGKKEKVHGKFKDMRTKGKMYGTICNSYECSQ